MDKDTKHIKDWSTGTEGYLEYTKENEKGKVNQLDVASGTSKTNTITKQKTTEYSREPKQKQANGAQVTEFTVYQGRVKTARTKLDVQYKVH